MRTLQPHEVERPKPTDELKEKYFAQYLNQVVFGGINYNPDYKNFVQVSTKLTPQNFKIFHTIITGNLRLKPVSKLTSEQLIKVAQIYHNDKNYNTSSVGKAIISTLFDDEFRVCPKPLTALYLFQYLISEGFAVPFMGYTVGELIELNWLVLVD